MADQPKSRIDQTADDVSAGINPPATEKPSKVELAAAIGKAIANLAIISASILTLLKKKK